MQKNQLPQTQRMLRGEGLARRRNELPFWKRERQQHGQKYG
jgi:hypothetical protein